MKTKYTLKDILILLSPFALFFVLVIPYSWFNQAFLVDWLGCGCPKLDEAGNMIHSYFNANDFTLLFWLFISLCATVIAGFLSKRIDRPKWLRFVYVAAVFALSVFVSYQLFQSMMWN